MIKCPLFGQQRRADSVFTSSHVKAVGSSLPNSPWRRLFNVCAEFSELFIRDRRHSPHEPCKGQTADFGEVVLFTSTLAHHSPLNIAVPSTGNACVDLRAEGNSCDAVCQLLKSQTCSGCSGTKRNRQITVETGASAHLTLNTNKQGSAWRQHSSFERCVCGLFLDVWFYCGKSFDLVELNINSVVFGDNASVLTSSPVYNWHHIETYCCSHTVQCSATCTDLSFKCIDWLVVLPSSVIALISGSFGTWKQTCWDVSSRHQLPLIGLVSWGQNLLYLGLRWRNGNFSVDQAGGPCCGVIEHRPWWSAGCFFFLTAGLKHAHFQWRKMIYFPLWEVWDLNLKWLNKPRVRKPFALPFVSLWAVFKSRASLWIIRHRWLPFWQPLTTVAYFFYHPFHCTTNFVYLHNWHIFSNQQAFI